MTGRGPEAAREAARGTGLIFLGTLFYQITEYLYRFTLARGLSLEGFGTFNQARSVFLVLVALAALGLGPGVKRFIALKRERGETAQARRAIRDGSRLLAVSAIGGGIAFFFLAGPLAALFHNPALIAPVRVLALAVPATIALDYVTRLGEAFRSFRATVIARNVLDPVLRLLASIALLLAGATLPAVMGAYAGAALLAMIVAVLLVQRLERRKALAAGPAPPQTGALLRFSLPLVLGTVVFDFAERIDVLMISIFRDEAQVGLYASGSALSRALLLFLSSTIPVVGTLAAEAVGRDATVELGSLHRMTARWSFLFATPLAAGLFLYPAEALSILFGREYAGAAVTLRILAPTYLLVVLGGPLGVMLNAIGKTHWTLANTALRVVVNIALNVVLIPRFGIVGAAIGTLVSMTLAVGILAGQLASFFPVRRSYVGWWRPLAALALACALSWIASRGLLGLGICGGGADLVAAVGGGLVLVGVFALVVKHVPGCLEEGDFLLLDFVRRRLRP